MINAARVGTPSGCENLYEAKTCQPYLTILVDRDAVNKSAASLYRKKLLKNFRLIVI
jgi:hypothetical protein